VISDNNGPARVYNQERLPGMPSMKLKFRTITYTIVTSVAIVLAVGGCVYYNTFFNAKQAFDEAEKTRKKNGQISQTSYQTAIDKSLKVVDYHANSKYYDDALYVLGVSYFYTKQYGKSERRFREILANYPNSKYTKESNLYLAKAKLELGDVAEAMVLFDQLFRSDFSRGIKAEAAAALGEFHFNEKDYARSESYFMSVRDSLGDPAQRKEAQTFIADGYMASYHFQDALSAYLQLLGMKPDKKERYRALYQAAMCSYRLMRIPEGIDYLSQLIKDPVYFDSLGVLQLAVGQGYEYSGDLPQAEYVYSEVTSKSTNPAWVSQAYYRMGLIYQFDYDNLPDAKKYYDEASKSGGGTDAGRDALQRSSDISKLDTFYAATKLDTNASQEKIDAVAATQYRLGELYWFQLNKPDSAINEMEYLVTKLPTAAIAPRALLAISQMYRDYLNDTVKADSVVRVMLTSYPRSDYVSQALEILGLKGSPADTGYAEHYFKRAENFLLDQKEVDSAKYYYQYVVDSFPSSKYFLQAKFNLIWVKENYEMPGDSSVILAYKEFIDSFPGTPLATEAQHRLPQTSSVRRVPRKREQDSVVTSDSTTVLAARDSAQARPADTGSAYIDPLQAVYRGPNGENLILLDIQPMQTLEEFEYPTDAYNLKDNQFILYFQILLDFSGKVLDYVLKSPSPSPEIDRRAGITIKSMTFNPLDISKEVSRRTAGADIPEPETSSQGRWYVFKYEVDKPGFVR
jgi:tetratricopeptide (TPR) repeat protein